MQFREKQKEDGGQATPNPWAENGVFWRLFTPDGRSMI